jgi:hypothetical protein
MQETVFHTSEQQRTKLCSESDNDTSGVYSAVTAVTATSTQVLATSTQVFLGHFDTGFSWSPRHRFFLATSTQVFLGFPVATSEC